MSFTLSAVEGLLALALQVAQTPDQTIESFKLPEGFSATLFAGEPDVRQPVGFCIDDRGRLWVLEGDSYPAWRESFKERDRIWIFEDADGDGKFDSKKLFADGLIYATGIEVGFGGVWVIAPPSLLFFPDKDGDDKPDGPAEVRLDGFGIHGGHNVVNGFTWGPDGWLYGGHGRTSISEIGPPGTPPGQRVHFDGGVYRYHPTRRVFEAFADGTTNPWGIAFDELGRMFVSNCVNAHLFHVVQGAHYEPWRDRPSSRHAYQRLDTIADHLHYASGRSAGDGGKEHDLLGGGHAHSGCLVYLGDTWPERYRGAILMSNLHGHRINMDVPKAKGSGFTASHGPDLLVSKDPMFTGLLLQLGPDGAVYLSDWYDRGECHTREPDRANGRIYKLQFGPPKPVKTDLAKLTDLQLVALQAHRNEWWVNRSRRLLQERGPKPEVHEALRKMLLTAPDSALRLRALWALHVTGGLEAGALLDHPDEHVRAWSVQLELEDRQIADDRLAKLGAMSVSDPSPIVRLQLATGVRRLPPSKRAVVLQGLVSHAEDASDPNLPHVIWYAAEELAESDLPTAMKLMKETKLPRIREFMARRISALSTDRPVLNVASLGAKGDGATDDSAAFATGLERLSTSGGRLLIPWGVRSYRIDKPVAAAGAGLEVWGPGARLQFGAGAGLALKGGSIAIKGIRLEGAGELLFIAGPADLTIEDLQAKGTTRIDGAASVSIGKSRFESLELAIPESGATLVGVTVDKSFKVTGDRAKLKTEGCKLP